MTTTVHRVDRARLTALFATGALFVGALLVRGRIVVGLLVVAAVFVPMERLLTLRPQRVLRAGWRTDLVHFVVDGALTTIGLVLVVVVAGGFLRALVPESVRHAIGGQPAVVQFALGLVIAEVGGYWGHRASHRVPWLWRFHRLHHSIEEMDWLAAARLHPIDQVFTRSCFVVPLLALGFSRATFGAFLVFATFQALFVHANVRVRFGPLRYVVATPQFHHWHHAAEPGAYDSNFAGELPVLDAVFGTLRMPAGWPERYGIDERAPSDYLHQLAWPFRHASPAAVVVPLPVSRPLDAVSQS